MQSVLWKYLIIGAFYYSCSTELKSPGKDYYDSNLESLKKYEIPEWYKDAKLGIFIHWGPYCVPEYGSEWYPRLMYMDEKTISPNGTVQSDEPSEIYKHHVKYWGTPHKFGYKDFVPMFTGENFDPDEWMTLFHNAGARYIVAVAEHSDGFAMYNSSHTRWNAVDMGPQKDILKELADAAHNRGLKFGASSHFAFNWKYYVHKEGYDTMDPDYFDLYGRPHEPLDPPDQQFLEHWWMRTKEIVDNYPLDILWFDFYWGNNAFNDYRPRVAAHFYNSGIKRNRKVVLNSKGLESFPEGTVVLDIERGKSKIIRKYPWQTDTSIGKNSWGYVKNWESKTADNLIDNLIDIVSKNGCLLLNIGPQKDGTIPSSQKEMLLEIGNWMKINGKAVYGTRPWKIFGEGPTIEKDGQFTESEKIFCAEDIRFTTKKGKVYATILSWPEDTMVRVKSLGLDSELIDNNISSVRLLGYNELITWNQESDKLTIHVPTRQPTPFAHVFEITFAG